MLTLRPFHPPWPRMPIAAQAWRQHVAPTQRLVVEIGAGAGLHAIQYARQHPQDFLIAIERTTVKFNKLQQRLRHHPGLTNVLAVQADAVEWITRHIAACELSGVFILYPNPYPKAQQANKRFMHMPFFPFLLQRIKVGGELYLATNEKFYYTQAFQRLSLLSDFHIATSGVITPMQAPRTHFEKKYLQRGLTCYQLQAIRQVADLAASLG